MSSDSSKPLPDPWPVLNWIGFGWGPTQPRHYKNYKVWVGIRSSKEDVGLKPMKIYGSESRENTKIFLKNIIINKH